MHTNSVTVSHSDMKNWSINKVVDSFLYNFSMLSGCSVYKGVKTCWISDGRLSVQISA